MLKFFLLFWILFSFVPAGSAYELRVWEDVDGNRFEGRFLRELFGRLSIEAEDGSTRTFELKKLSELDQKYLRVMVPPEMQTEVRTKSIPAPPRPATDRQEVFYDDHQATVLITKKSQRPFTSRLKVEIFMVAEEIEGDHYILLDRTEKEILLPTISKGAEFEFKSRIVRTMRFRGAISEQIKGEEFCGYLLVISTMQGDIVLTKSNLPALFEDPQVITNLQALSIAGAASVRSRHFDEAGRNVPPPRPEHRSATDR